MCDDGKGDDEANRTKDYNEKSEGTNNGSAHCLHVRVHFSITAREHIAASYLCS